MRESQDVALFDLFLEEFPDGKFAKLAVLYRQKLVSEQNKTQEVASVDASNEPVADKAVEPVKDTQVDNTVPVDSSTKVANLWKDAVKNEQETGTLGSSVPLKGKELVKAIQTELNRIGCPTGTPDGVAGKKTQNALRGYRNSGGPNWARGFSQKLLEQLQGEDPKKCNVTASKSSKKKSRSKSNPLRKIKKIFKIN